MAVECVKCGRCCLANVSAIATDEDRERWQREGRHDILQVLEDEGAVWGGSRPGSGLDEWARWGCPFLLHRVSQVICSIYETRPRTCRGFTPGATEFCSLFPCSRNE